MKNLLEFILKEILPSADIKISEEENEENFTSFTIEAPSQFLGLIIGKDGKTIKALRNLLKVRATLEKRGVSLSVVERVGA